MTTERSVEPPDGGVSACRESRIHGEWLASLAKHYTPALRRFFERKLSCKSDAADLAQDVFMRLSRMQSAETIEKPENYLFKIASNVLRDHYRRKAVRQSYARSLLTEDPGDHELSPADIIEGRDAIRELEHILRAMPVRTCDIFVLRMLEGRTTADVASSLGISTRAVEKHYAKALARITRALRAYRG